MSLPSPTDTARSIGAVLAARAASHPDLPAVVAADRTLTWADLNAAANRVANRLLSRLGPGEARIGVACRQGPDAVATILGVLKAGMTFIVLDPHLPAARLREITDDAQPALALCDAPGRPLAAQAMADGETRVVGIDAPASPGDDREPPIDVSPEAVAFILYTSGSTGRPKGVMQRHASMLHFVRCYCDAMNVSEGDRLTMLYSMSFAAAYTDTFSAVLSGAALYPRDLRQLGLTGLADWVDAHRLTILHTVPTVLRHFTQSLPRDRRMPSVRAVDLGGEPVNWDDVIACRRHFSERCRVVNHLAATEASVIAQKVIDADVAPATGSVPVGRSVDRVRAWVADDSGRPCEPGRIGQLIVDSPFVSPGYWNRPELSAAAFGEAPDRPGWRRYRSGDLARVNEAGELEHLGRADHRVKIRGHSVDPGDVEAAIVRTGRAREAAVVAQADESGERRLIAFIVAPPGAEAGDVPLRAAVRALLPDYMCPWRFVRLPALPVTVTGKVDRRALQAEAEAELPAGGGPATPDVPRRDASIESRLQAIWARVLGLDAIGPDESFFDLGGHSLLALRLSMAIEKAFGQTMALSVLLESPTIRQLSARLRDGSLSPRDGCLVPLAPRGGRPPLFCLPGIGGHVMRFRDLALRLGDDQPVYGLEFPGIDGRGEPLPTVEQIAERLIADVVRVRPAGPCVLCGYSFGGIVAYEMARQLVAARREVAAVLLLDTVAPGGSRPRSLASQMLVHLRVLITGEAGPRLGYLGERLAGGLSRLGLGRPRRRTDAAPRVRARIDAVGRANHAAVRRYAPGRYEGPVVLIRARRPAGIARLYVFDPLKGWGRFASNVTEHVVPGTHETLLQPDRVATLAEQVRRCLDRAARDPRTAGANAD